MAVAINLSARGRDNSAADADVSTLKMTRTDKGAGSPR
jgi:hypothetical protein